MAEREIPLSGQKDADLHILQYLDTRTLLDFCSQNNNPSTQRNAYITKRYARFGNRYLKSLCDTESLWMNRTISEYSQEIADFKTPERTWKQYYLLLIHLLNEYPLDRVLYHAVKFNSDLIYPLLRLGADINPGFEAAAEMDLEDILDTLIEANRIINNVRGELGPEGGYTIENLRAGFIGAARGEYLHLLNFFHHAGADNIREALEVAAETGNFKILNFFSHNIGGDDANDAIVVVRGAARGRQDKVIKHVLDQGLEVDERNQIACILADAGKLNFLLRVIKEYSPVIENILGCAQDSLDNLLMIKRSQDQEGKDSRDTEKRITEQRYIINYIRNRYQEDADE